MDRVSVLIGNGEIKPDAKPTTGKPPSHRSALPRGGAPVNVPPTHGELCHGVAVRIQTEPGVAAALRVCAGDATLYEPSVEPEAEQEFFFVLELVLVVDLDQEITTHRHTTNLDVDLAGGVLCGDDIQWWFGVTAVVLVVVVPSGYDSRFAALPLRYCDEGMASFVVAVVVVAVVTFVVVVIVVVVVVVAVIVVAFVVVVVERSVSEEGHGIQ